VGKEFILYLVKGIVHFEILFWYVLAYRKGIQDVGVFVSTVVSILIFLGQTFLSVSHIMQVSMLVLKGLTLVHFSKNFC